MYIYGIIDRLNNEKYKRHLTVRQYEPLHRSLLKKLGLIGPPPEEYCRPLMILCETVNICSNNCIICTYGKMTRKKATMPMELFEKVLKDYSDIGGGYLSLTPKQGEVFLDSLLARRIELVKKYPAITALSITTNAIPVNRYDDGTLKGILTSLKKIQVSIYGLDREEYALLTRRDYYGRMMANISRMFRLLEGSKVEVTFGFRFLKPRSDEEVGRWIADNFGRKISFHCTREYMDWNGALDAESSLPDGGKWQKKIVNADQCILPLVTCAIFSNGDVSICPCNDYDAREELKIGNVSNTSLLQMFNSKKVEDFWALKPEYFSVCKNCTSHRSVSSLDSWESMFSNPLDAIGG